MNRFSENSPIVVLGADGYLGWPLALCLAKRHPSRPIVCIDNGLRRKLVREVGGGSLMPILSLEERLNACREIHGCQNLRAVEIDVNSEALDAIIREYRPAAVYHLAQQCSAPYSMRGAEQALFTLYNNEGGNMRLLWAVKRYAPECHIVKLGSFGEYAKSGLEIAEGYFLPTYRGKIAERPIPYPRESDDFYHVSKINDTNYISVACRKWGLRITDVMQSTVFGCWTPEIDQHTPLFTRMDYDECFGTVANRFVAQALGGVPLTVYGSGHQRTGLMALNDSIDSLAGLWNTPPPPSTHRVINHLTEYYSVNELARTVQAIAAHEGLKVEIQSGIHDPRDEKGAFVCEYVIERTHIDRTVLPTRLEAVVKKAIHHLLHFGGKIDRGYFTPTTRWNAVEPKTEQDPRQTFRKNHFPYRPINLNPGALGVPSRDVQEAMRNFGENDLLAHPLGQYRKGRAEASAAIEIARQLWPSTEHTLHIGTSASQCSNLLALALARLAASQQRTLRLLTTQHEHIGGIGAFLKMPEFQVGFLSDAEMSDPGAFEKRLMEFRPDLTFFSHVTFDTGRILPVEKWGALIKQRTPETLTVVDLSQSLGYLAPSFEYADALFSSCHKWLFGPLGTGLLWTNEFFRNRVEALYWSGEPLLKTPEGARFGVAGGMDFSVFAGLKAALQLQQKNGDRNIHSRSLQLMDYFSERLLETLDRHEIDGHISRTGTAEAARSPILTVAFPDFDPYSLYAAMNENGVYSKCIKDSIGGAHRQLLRFGFPYYETEDRLDRALSIIDDCLTRVRAAEPARIDSYRFQIASSPVIPNPTPSKVGS